MHNLHTVNNLYLQIRAEEFSHTVLHPQRPGQPGGGPAIGGGGAFKPVVGRPGVVVGRPLPPAPRPQPQRIHKLDPPPQPAAQPNKRYNPVAVYGGPRRDPDDRSVEQCVCGQSPSVLLCDCPLFDTYIGKRM